MCYVLLLLTKKYMILHCHAMGSLQYLHVLLKQSTAQVSVPYGIQWSSGSLRILTPGSFTSGALQTLRESLFSELKIFKSLRSSHVPTCTKNTSLGFLIDSQDLQGTRWIPGRLDSREIEEEAGKGWESGQSPRLSYFKLVLVSLPVLPHL